MNKFMTEVMCFTHAALMCFTSRNPPKLHKRNSETRKMRLIYNRYKSDCSTPRENEGQRGTLRALAGTCRFLISYF